MSWSPVTSRVRRHIAHRGFDAQKQWVISCSPWVALAIVFPETPAQMFDPWIRGDHYPSSGFARLQECDPLKRDKGFIYLII